jgi:hypothetical protein
MPRESDKNNSYWPESYPESGEEEVPKDLPLEKSSRVRVTVYVDANHAHDLLT